MTRQQVLLRADASHAIGYGHVARIAALFEELVQGEQLEPRAMFGGDGAVAGWLQRQGMAVELGRHVGAWTTGDVLAAACEANVRAVVIDGPALADALVPALAEHGVRTVVIDDVGDCGLAVDVVVNHNFHAAALAASYPAAQLCLLGRPYLMLRKAIRRHGRAACRVAPNTGERLRVVVTFGGSDPVGATARVVAQLPRERALDVNVIAGPGFRDDAALATAVGRASAAGHRVTVVRDPDDAGALFAQAHAAICAAGGTPGELAYLGCPALAFAIVDNQVAAARSLANAELIAGGQIWQGLDDGALRDALAGFVVDDARRLALRQNALATADDHGPRRIASSAW